MELLNHDRHDIRKGSELYLRLFPKALFVPIESTQDSSYFKLTPRVILRVTSSGDGVYYQFICRETGKTSDLIYNPNLVITKFKRGTYFA